MKTLEKWIWLHVIHYLKGLLKLTTTYKGWNARKKIELSRDRATSS